jgi:hypothetical protein
MVLLMSCFMEVNVMEERERAPRRAFTPEQKFEIVRDVKRRAIVKEGLQKCRIALGITGFSRLCVVFAHMLLTLLLSA